MLCTEQSPDLLAMPRRAYRALQRARKQRCERHKQIRKKEKKKVHLF